MGEAALLLFLSFLVTGGIGYGVQKWDERRTLRKQQLKGEENAKRLLREHLICFRCEKKVNPEVDAYQNGRWWCADCFKQVIE